VSTSAILIAFGYYAGANLGFLLRFPPSTPSVLWPPNSILTAALLLTPPRRWWICLLAALPAHLAAEFQVAWPTTLVLALFLTNCSEALIAAVGVRLLSDAPTRLDTLRRMSVFIGAAGLVAPFLSSFLDAGVVTTLRGEAYWLVWGTRFFSNVLTELLLVPVIVMTATLGRAWITHASRARKAEAVLVLAALVLVAGWAFGVIGGGPRVLEGPVAPVVLLLPIVLLAMARLGSAGASLCLLTTALIAVGAAVNGRAPFAGMPLAETVMELQMVLIVMAIPVLCLAAGMMERRRGLRRFARRVAELRANEALRSAILASLNSAVAVLDEDGQIIAVNTSWTRASDGPACPISAGLGVGDNFLEACRQAAGDAPYAAAAVSGITGVLGGTRAGFTLEYPCRREAGEYWFAMSVVRLDRPEGGAVVSCTDVSERKRAELHVEQNRQELTHFMRVSMMGELTASLAHELNQPLTGIMANAAAGLRFLGTVPPKLDEVREILADILADDKRAGDVIQRLREFLRKSEPRRVPLDVNLLTQDVVRLLGSDAVIRSVTIRLELDDKPAIVCADGVQLQQVILNLLLNAMDAIGDGPDDRRSIVVRTHNTELETVHVSVEDSGTGLKTGNREMLFEPFFTTKPTGMGMGLAISRSIIEAHDGVIWALDNATGGATFHFALPEFRGGAT